MEQMIFTFPILLGVIFIGLYLISHSRLLNFLKNNYPEKWKELGEPEFIDDSDAGDMKRFIQFLRSPNDIEDPEVINMKSKTKTFLIIGVILIGGSLSYWIVRFLILFLSTPQ
jgi:hypothetical protein